MSLRADTLLAMTRKRSTQNLTLSLAFLALSTGGMAACKSDSGIVAEDGDQRVYYCTDESNTVVPDDRCDEDGDGRGGTYYLFHTASGGASYSPGQRIPASSGSRFPYHDQAARKAAGLPETGRVSNGTTKTGVVGKGGGAPAKGGSAGS